MTNRPSKKKNKVMRDTYIDVFKKITCNRYNNKKILDFIHQSRLNILTQKEIYKVT